MKQEQMTLTRWVWVRRAPVIVATVLLVWWVATPHCVTEDRTLR